MKADWERSMLPEAHSGQRSTAVASTVFPLSVIVLIMSKITIHTVIKATRTVYSEISLA